MMVPIDQEIAFVKQQIKQRSLQLKQINTEMANTRAKYAQNHVHGGGFLNTITRNVQRARKNANLHKRQPEKERLQNEKLALEQQLAQLNLMKSQGTTHVQK